MLLNNLIGTWFLQEWDCTLNGDYHNHPFGRDAQGVITYSPSGRMSAILMKAGQAQLKEANLQRATDAERQHLLSGYVSYAGSWRVEGDNVIHCVDFSLLPNWIGTELVRKISWTPNAVGYRECAQLILSTQPMTTRSGDIVVNRLRWKLQ